MMKTLALTFAALTLLSSAASFADEKTEKTETHETDGKTTTRTKKVKRKADGKGNSSVEIDTVRKTEVK